MGVPCGEAAPARTCLERRQVEPANMDIPRCPDTYGDYYLSIQSEVLGLRAWLFGIDVPVVMPKCSCGHPRQTIQQVMGYCRDQVEARAKLLDRAGHTEMKRLCEKRSQQGRQDSGSWAKAHQSISK